MATASSAISTWRAALSASEKTATVLIPMRRAVLMMRQAISPRLAIRIVLNMAPLREKRLAFLQRSFLWERRKRVNNRRRLGPGRTSAVGGQPQEQTST